VQNLSYFREKDVLSICDSSDNEMDSDNSAIEIINVRSIFSNIPIIENKNSDNLCLPKHIKCCAHILHLIATYNFSKIVDTNYV
jgi:hypothetical protein